MVDLLGAVCRYWVRGDWVEQWGVSLSQQQARVSRRYLITDGKLLQGAVVVQFSFPPLVGPASRHTVFAFATFRSVYDRSGWVRGSVYLLGFPHHLHDGWWVILVGLKKGYQPFWVINLWGFCFFVKRTSKYSAIIHFLYMASTRLRQLRFLIRCWTDTILVSLNIWLIPWRLVSGKYQSGGVRIYLIAGNFY